MITHTPILLLATLIGMGEPPRLFADQNSPPAAAFGFLTPSPGTPGEGWGEGLAEISGKTLTLTLSRRTGRGDRTAPASARDCPEVDPQAVGASGKPKPAAKGLTVAILDFEASTPASPDLGKQIGEALAATLSGQDGFSLVDRASMKDTLGEAALNLTGLIDPAKANKIGKLVGANILITGKVFPLDKQLFFTAKIIGTETTRMEGVLVKGDKDSDMGELMMKLSEKVASRLGDAGPKLVAQPEAMEDPLPGLKKALAGRKLPIVGVHIRETQAEAAPAVRIDPAVEVEVQMLLKEAGFTVIDGEQNYAEAGVTLVISGDAFSEFAARIGTLVNCTARAEIKITDRKTGQLLFSDRATTRAVDLAKNTASKTALQKAGHALGIDILRYFEKKEVEKAAPKKK